ncbi:DUF2878 domain-containing protein [Enterovibrio sp. 27052020O]|uniref:DUF2878 domain-containing protein n=1 Tax=Enterovibrio sp. 27052020O TaxID=3241166 RepID=UPI00388D12D2
MRIILISLAFNLYWFAAVVGQNSFLPLLVLALIASMFIDRGVIIAIPLFALIGISGDAVLMSNQILMFNTPFLPLWLCLLWAGFGAYLWLIKDWVLEKNIGLLIVAGAFGGAMSYLGGERLGAVSFGQPYWVTAAVLAVGWAMYSVVFLALLKYFQSKGGAWLPTRSVSVKK